MKPSTEHSSAATLGRALAAVVAAVAGVALAAEAWRPGLAAGVNPGVLVALAALSAWLAGGDAGAAPGSPWPRRAMVVACACTAALVASQWVVGPWGWQAAAGIAAAVAVIGAGW
jgi:hypothetical protein